MKSSKAIVSHVCMIHPGLYSIAHPLVCYILLNVLLGNSSGWRADTVATYSKSRNLQLTKKKQNKIWRTSGYATLYHVFIISGPRSASVPHLAATELTPSGMCDEERERGECVVRQRSARFPLGNIFGGGRKNSSRSVNSVCWPHFLGCSFSHKKRGVMSFTTICTCLPSFGCSLDI